MMTKKMINHIKDISMGKQYLYEGRYFATDFHRVIEFAEPIEGLEIDTNGSACAKMIDYALSQGILHEMPTPNELREGIREKAGRCLDRVIYADPTIAVNARWLLKAKESLNANNTYIAEENPHRNPIVLFAKDDMQNIIKEAILPIMYYTEKNHYKRG